MPIRNIRFLQNNIMNTSEPSPDRFQKLMRAFQVSPTVEAKPEKPIVEGFIKSFPQGSDH
jgi:hypothetical protein